MLAIPIIPFSISADLVLEIVETCESHAGMCFIEFGVEPKFDDAVLTEEAQNRAWHATDFASPSSLVVTYPPSKPLMSLLACNEKHSALPNEPILPLGTVS